jgi:hypothetical protein
MIPTTPGPSTTPSSTSPFARPADAAHESNGQPRARTEDAETSERLAARLLEHVNEGAAHLRTLVSVGSEQARLRLRRARGTIVQLAVMGCVGAAIAIAGAVYFARGLAGTLGALLGSRPWLGELAAGLVLLGLVGAGLAFAMAREERSEMERLRKKYAPEPRDGEKPRDGAKPETGKRIDELS